MKSTEILILAIIWTFGSLLWFFCIQNIMMGTIWLCAGIAELIIALIKRSKEKKLS